MLTKKLFPFGENGITFTLFNDLVEKERISRFLANIDWTNISIKKELEKEKIEFVFLFPALGKSKGTPDAIITTENYNIIFEFETTTIEKLSNHYIEQMTRFIDAGKDIYISNRKKLTKLGLPYSDGSKVIGTYKQRKMFQEILGKKPYYVLITKDTSKNSHKIFTLVKNIWPSIYEYFGFMDYGRIKKMKNLPNIRRIIDFNLDE
jgi:hypothetical protein